MAQFLRSLARNIGSLIFYEPPPPSAISQEGYQAFKDGALRSDCPYARQAQAEEWQLGWDEGKALK